MKFVRLTEEHHRKIKTLAAQSGQTMQDVINAIMAEGLKRN